MGNNILHPVEKFITLVETRFIYLRDNSFKSF